MVRGTANTALFIGGIGQIILGNTVNGVKNDGDHVTYPKWGIPRQFDKNWNLETKTSWMGGALGTISWDDGKDVMLNTASVVTAFFPFSQAANTLEKTAENILISTTITTTTSMTVDAINDAKSTSTTNSNNSTNTIQRIRNLVEIQDLSLLKVAKVKFLLRMLKINIENSIYRKFLSII